ncbi:hypothetical protein RND81_13G033600 [Saponaria officinalis]|uniref:Uncharacterized protein n=1 Tax=Saponaria officinalis TaxID=3572 RepID=A0AAW1GY50_SAPOF
MDAVKVAIPVDVSPPKLMMSEVVGGGGVRVCENDGGVRQSDAVSGFSASKIDECSSFVGNRGSEGKQTPRKVGKVPRNGSVSFKKPRMFPADNVLPQPENGAEKMELDTLDSHFVKCSNADKSQTGKQRNNINGKRGDRRNSKVPMKAKFDPFSLKAGSSSFSPAAGGSNTFGMYGLKPDIHDITKYMEDISLDELLDGTYKCPTFGNDTGKKTANVNDNVLDSVRKVCSLIRPQGMQQDKETKELDMHDVKKTPSPSSPSNNSVEDGSDGDGNSIVDLSKCNKDVEPCSKADASTNLSISPVFQPREILERLALPPPKDLELLLQDALKPAASMKLTDSRSSKQLSNRVSLPAFLWSHNFNGHYKSNNDALKTSNKSTCSGRWVRISSTASFIGGSAQGFVDLESLTYDDSLVPAGQLKYRLPEVGKTSTTSASQPDASPSSCRAASLPPPAMHPPKVLAAARTLCDMASQSSKHNMGGILKWPKPPSHKAMKARKSKLNEIPEDELFSAPKSETALDHVARSVEHGSSSKKPKIPRESYSHVQAVIGLSSVSAPRSNRPSPGRHSESRHLNGSFLKSSFLVPPPPRVLDRSSQNPQKLRKITPDDWNRPRS